MNHRSFNHMSFIDHEYPIPLICTPKTSVMLMRFNESKIAFKFNQDFYLAPSECSHRGSSLKDASVCTHSAALVCPYHGKKTRAEQKLFEYLGILWTRDPQNYFLEAKDYVFCGSHSFTLNAAYHVVLDNFNEGSHTAHAHRLLGPAPEQTSDIQFTWHTEPDHLFIEYIGPQRKNFLFYGLNRMRLIDWHISWKAYFHSSHMAYRSKWLDHNTGKKVLSENLNYYFINPIDESTTELTALVFIRPAAWMRFFIPIVKKVSLLLTANQIEEDITLYKKIGKIPKNFKSQSDKFDEPLAVLRQKMDSLFQKFL